LSPRASRLAFNESASLTGLEPIFACASAGKGIEEKMKIREEKNRKEKGDAWFSKLMKKISF
jgi:hypothetical protein